MYAQNTIRTTTDIRTVADYAGSYFFSPDTMRAFSSRVLSGVTALDGNEAKPGARFLFVTSERHGDDSPRHYAVRMMTLVTDERGRDRVDIISVGYNLPTAAQARAQLKKLATAPSCDMVKHGESCNRPALFQVARGRATPDNICAWCHDLYLI